MTNIIESLRAAYIQNPAEALNMLPELFEQYDAELVKVMPCKVGDTVFVPCTTSILETTVTSIQFYEDCIVITTKNYNEHKIINSHAFYLSDFWKTVFLTREAAEAALKAKA